ncbi:hypothetical protein C8R47DRAFT_1244412 [Mycena vitilis]|nr:hypothetical protein C8R47DRAFT_1244412 [Mycena vitilis]
MLGRILRMRAAHSDGKHEAFGDSAGPRRGHRCIPVIAAGAKEGARTEVSSLPDYPAHASVGGDRGLQRNRCVKLRGSSPAHPSGSGNIRVVKDGLNEASECLRFFGAIEQWCGASHCKVCAILAVQSNKIPYLARPINLLSREPEEPARPHHCCRKSKLSEMERSTLRGRPNGHRVQHQQWYLNDYVQALYKSWTWSQLFFSCPTLQPTDIYHRNALLCLRSRSSLGFLAVASAAPADVKHDGGVVPRGDVSVVPSTIDLASPAIPDVSALTMCNISVMTTIEVMTNLTIAQNTTIASLTTGLNIVGSSMSRIAIDCKEVTTSEAAALFGELLATIATLLAFLISLSPFILFGVCDQLKFFATTVTLFFQLTIVKDNFIFSISILKITKQITNILSFCPSS